MYTLGCTVAARKHMRKNVLMSLLALTVVVSSYQSVFARESPRPGSSPWITRRDTGRNPSDPNAPKVVPFSCGSCHQFTNNGLTLSGDGFDIYTSFPGTGNNQPAKIPFAPGVLSFTISNAPANHTINVTVHDVNNNGFGGPSTTLVNGTYQVNLSTLDPNNLIVLRVAIEPRDGTCVARFSNIVLNGQTLAGDLTHVDGCQAGKLEINGN